MKKLVFVYNGDSGLLNGLVHYLHKRISPETYPCQLCALVYEGASINKEWLEFVNSLGVETEFLHSDEYEKKYRRKDATLPAIFLYIDDAFQRELISKSDFSSIKDLATLKSRVLENALLIKAQDQSA